MPCDVSIGWIYYICSNFFDNVIPIFRVYYFIFCCYFDNCIRWFYYYRLSYIWSNFPIIWIYCVGRCGGLTSSFSWDSNIILTFFATSIFFVFYWRWDCFYVYFILSWNFNDRISWFFVRTGFPTLGVISPVVGFTLYVVVIVSSPSSPLTVIASVPFSFVSSFS